MNSETQMPEKKNKNVPDFPTSQFLRSIKHWTDSFISGETRIGVFLNSIQDDAYSYCKAKNRMDEWSEFIQDYVSEDYSESSDDSSSSGDAIEIDGPNQ